MQDFKENSAGLTDVLSIPAVRALGSLFCEPSLQTKQENIIEGLGVTLC